MTSRKGSQSKGGGMDFALKIVFSRFRNPDHIGLIHLQDLLHFYSFYVFPQKRVTLLIFSTYLACKYSRNLKFPWLRGYDSEVMYIAY